MRPPAPLSARSRCLAAVFLVYTAFGGTHGCTGFGDGEALPPNHPPVSQKVRKRPAARKRSARISFARQREQWVASWRRTSTRRGLGALLRDLRHFVAYMVERPVGAAYFVRMTLLGDGPHGPRCCAGGGSRDPRPLAAGPREIQRMNKEHIQP